MYPTTQATRRPKAKRVGDFFLRPFENEAVNVASCESVRTFASHASQRGRKYGVMWDMWDVEDVGYVGYVDKRAFERNAKLVIIVSLKEDLGSPKKKKVANGWMDGMTGMTAQTPSTIASCSYFETDAYIQDTGYRIQEKTYHISSNPGAP